MSKAIWVNVNMHVKNVKHFALSYTVQWVGKWIAGVSLFQGKQRLISLSTSRQGAALRLIVQPGWWTLSRMEREMERGIVGSPSRIPWDPITSHPTTHTPTHTYNQGSGSIPDLRHPGLGRGGGTVGLLFELTSLRGFSERERVLWSAKLMYRLLAPVKWSYSCVLTNYFIWLCDSSTYKAVFL